MPNGKTRFIAGAIVGATTNFIIQSAQMAMDYDRKFDLGEFFLCAGAGAFAANPKGIASFSPGLASLRAYPGFAALEFHYPERVASSAPGSIIHRIKNSGGTSEIADFHTLRHLLSSLISAGLIAWAISGKHTLKLSRTTRLFLWAFGISHLSHIALDCTNPKQINLL